VAVSVACTLTVSYVTYDCRLPAITANVQHSTLKIQVCFLITLIATPLCLPSFSFRPLLDLFGNRVRFWHATKNCLCFVSHRFLSRRAEVLSNHIRSIYCATPGAQSRPLTPENPRQDASMTGALLSKPGNMHVLIIGAGMMCWIGLYRPQLTGYCQE
jgi:hypothetical protein